LKNTKDIKLGKQFKLLNQVVGAYALLFLIKSNEIIAARLGSPSIGIGKENTLSLLMPPFIEYTSNAVYLRR
jgi:glucosamine 6-phosphate synthetase-like amidotransferase/phosphosugar isomerase protein